MPPLRPRSNVLPHTTPPVNQEASGSNTTTIALAIITSLAGFLCLPFKMATGLSVIVLGAAAYYTCSPKIAETTGPFPQPQKRDVPAPVSTPQQNALRTSTVTPVLPAQTKTMGPINIEIGDISTLMCTFDTVESRNAFLTANCQERLDSCANIVLSVPEPTKVTFMTKNGYSVHTILSRLCAHHLKKGRPVQITVSQGGVICKFTTPESVLAFMKSDIAKNLQKSVVLETDSARGTIFIRSSVSFTPCNILSEVAKTLMGSFNPDESSYSAFQSFY